MSMVQMIGILIGVVIPLVTGVLTVQKIEGRRGRPNILTLCFAASVGFAIHSIGYLLWALVLRPLPGGWIGVDLVILAGAGVVWRIRARAAVEPVTITQHVEPRWLAIALVASVGISLWMAGTATWWLIMREPLGRWDAWAIWNFKARMLYLAPPHVDAVFASPFPHPDYPLLLPLSLARLWRYAGGDAPAVPQGLAIVVTLLTTVTLAAGLAVMRGMIAGCVGGLVLLSSLFFIRHGASQLADTLVSMHMLMGLIAAVMWVEHETELPEGSRPRFSPSLLMVGMLGGCAAWTKNEGISFAVYLMMAVGAYVVIRHRRRSLRPLGALGAGAAGFAGMLALHRMALAERGTDLFLHVDGSTLIGRLMEGDRYLHVFRGVRAVLMSTIDWPVVALMLAAGAMAAWRRRRRRRADSRAAGLVAVVLGGQFVTYLLIYLTTPHDVSWHLLTSADRVLMQLWPGTVLLLCLLLPGRGIEGTKDPGRL